MSETANAPATETFVTPPAAVPLVSLIADAVKEANSFATQVKDAKTGADLRIQKALSESDDEKVAKWREWQSSIQKKIEENKAAIIKHITDTLLADLPQVNVDEVNKQYLAKRQQVTAYKIALKALLGGSDEDLSKALAAAGIEEIVNLRGGGAHSGAVTGGSKPRFASGSYNGKTYEKPTLTEIAKNLDVDLDSLRKGFFDAIGTQDWQSKVGETVTFTVVNKKSETVEISLVPRKDERKKSE